MSNNRIPKTWVFEEWNEIIFKHSHDEELRLMQALFDRCYINGRWADNVTIEDAQIVSCSVSTLVAHHLKRFSQACDILLLVKRHPDFASIDISELSHVRSKLGLWLWLSGEHEQAIESWEHLFGLSGREWVRGRLELWTDLSIIAHDESSPTDAPSGDLRAIALRVLERWPGRDVHSPKIRQATTNAEFAIALDVVRTHQDA